MLKTTKMAASLFRLYRCRLVPIPVLQRVVSGVYEASRSGLELFSPPPIKQKIKKVQIKMHGAFFFWLTITKAALSNLWPESHEHLQATVRCT